MSGGLLARAIGIGKVTGPATGADNWGNPVSNVGIGTPKNADKAKKVRLMQVRIGPKLQTVQLLLRAGEDFVPPTGTVVVIIGNDGINLGVVASDGIAPDANLLAGELKHYASNGSGTILARQKFKNNGKYYLGNASGNLGSGIDSLISALNDLITGLTTFTTGLNAGTLVAQAAACVTALGVVSTEISTAKSAIDGVLDTAE